MTQTSCKIKVHHGHIEIINKVVDLVDFGKDFVVGKDNKKGSYNIEKSFRNWENKRIKSHEVPS